MSSHVRNPIPPITINSIITIFTTALPEKNVREENCSRTPIRSNPALQNADTEWKSEYHIPRAGPNSDQNTGSIRTAPVSSTAIVIFMAKEVRRTIPPTSIADMESCIVLLWRSPILLPDSIAKAAAIVTTPSPPICISVSMTA